MTDASGDSDDSSGDLPRGWGFLVYEHRDKVSRFASGQFEEHQHIFIYEMRAVIQLLDSWAPSPPDKWLRLLIGIDNLPLVRALDREYTSSRAGRPYLLRLLQICQDKRIEILPHWVGTPQR